MKGEVVDGSDANGEDAGEIPKVLLAEALNIPIIIIRFILDNPLVIF